MGHITLSWNFIIYWAFILFFSFRYFFLFCFVLNYTQQNSRFTPHFVQESLLLDSEVHMGIRNQIKVGCMQGNEPYPLYYQSTHSLSSIFLKIADLKKKWICPWGKCQFFVCVLANQNIKNIAFNTLSYFFNVCRTLLVFEFH